MLDHARMGNARMAVVWVILAGCGGTSSSTEDCPSGMICDGACVNVGTEPTSCGACGNVCPTGEPFCEGGACVAACSQGLTECSGACVDINADAAHCGGCDTACTADQGICEVGNCVATSNCPAPAQAPGGDCPADCTGGCQGATCTIDCSGQGSPCDGANIACPVDFDCVVLCNGTDACDSGTIRCPPDFACTVICGGGNDACGDQTITCGAGPCHVECAGDACQGGIVACGTGACSVSCGEPVPSVECGNACACSGC